LILTQREIKRMRLILRISKLRKRRKIRQLRNRIVSFQMLEVTWLRT